jgi:hypothetical protein
MILNWNTPPTNKRLLEWLKAVKEAGLTPYITLRKCEPEPESYTSATQIPCPEKQPTYKEYRASVKTLMETLIHGNSERSAVRLWGSWNEPEHSKSPLESDPSGARKAAYLWGETQRAVEEAGCDHHCTVVAGEFSEFDPHHLYIERYEEDILHAERKHRFPTGVKPHVWGMHDYADLLHVHGKKQSGKETLGSYRNTEAHGFIEQTKKMYRSAHVWLSEQGVLLETQFGKTTLEKDSKLQPLAAEDFLRLGRASEHVEWDYYYEYRGPSEPEQFDSGLLSGNGKEPEDWRPAYCILVLGDKEGCPPKATTEPAVAGTTTANSSTVLLTVDPRGLSTNYFIEYGTTTSYGQITAATAVANPVGAQSETVTLDELEPCTTYHYQAEAENSDNEGAPSFGGDETFTSGGCGPTVITGDATRLEAGYEFGLNYELAGEVDPNGKATTYYFEYGPNTAYGHTTPVEEAGSGSNLVDVSEEVYTEANEGEAERAREFEEWEKEKKEEEERERNFDRGPFIRPDLELCRKPKRWHFRLVGVSAGGTSYGADERMSRCH